MSDLGVPLTVKHARKAGTTDDIWIISHTLDVPYKKQNPWKPSTQLYRNICLLCCDTIKSRSKTNPYSWEAALRNTKNASNAKDHIKLKHADHPLAIHAEQSATDKSRKDVESTEVDSASKVIESAFKSRFNLDIRSLTRYTMSDTTPSAKNVADHIDTEQENCSMHLLNLCIGYGIGLKDNIQTTTVWNESTGSWDKIVTTVTPGGALYEGGDVIHKLRNLNNHFRSPKQRNALKKIQKALSYPELKPMTDQDSENLVSSYMVVFRRLAENKLEAFKFESMAIEAPGAKDASEASRRRATRTRDQFSDAGKTCLRRTLMQLQARFPKVITESMACVLLVPRTKSSAKKIAAVGNIPRKEEKAIYKNGVDFIRVEHRKVFAQMTKQGKISLLQPSRSQSSLLSQDSSPFSSPSSTGWDDADELLLGAPIRATKTRDELKETEINARADAVLREWIDLEPEWLEVTQRQSPKIKIEDLSKDMSIDAQSGMHYALLGLYKHIDV
ncbi:hypothetical protein PInf_017627 [Phytophthora infestans]|nr:hypothetical protein PInf_017627 [Phytophthora infestans]